MPARLRKLARWSAILALSTAAIGATAASVLLARASIQTTAHGAPMRLRLHLPQGRDIAIPVNVARDEPVRIPGFLDGPVVRQDADGRWHAQWFCEDAARATTLADGPLRIECAGTQRVFDLQSPPVPDAVAPMPDRLVVLSDLEGNSRFLDAALQRLGIMDAAGNWTHGAGHLVILGDSVDRGRGVFAVLWRLHDLASQAAAAGGAVHLVLGNHEQYMLRGNPSRAHPDHLYALNEMDGYRTAFAADTVIGAWLRQQPVALKLGTVLFVHGGISPRVARSGLSIVQLNDAMREYWKTRGDQPPSPALDAVLGPGGITQYRGWLKGSEGRYPLAGDADVAQALDRFGASMAVVGHTLVERVTRMRDDRVFAVDVNHRGAAPEVLVFEHGQPRVVDIGIARNIGDEDPAFREFEPSRARDRQLLVDMVRDLRRLSRLPYPY
jgi:hypothetical protein